MGLRSRDALARANSVVNERNARAGRVRRNASAPTSSASGNKTTTTTTTTTGKRRDETRGGLFSQGRRKKIRWPDMENSTREVTASGREVVVEPDVKDGPASSSSIANDGAGKGGKTKPRLRQSLETTIEYTPSASEDSMHGDAFNRLPSVGAGAYVRGYDDSDEDSASDEHDRAMRRAVRELEFANQGDSCSCCVVM
jgi:hypothetical protein